MDVVENIKMFIRVISNATYDFYGLKKFEGSEGILSPNDLITSDENISSLMTTVLFKDEKFNGLVIDLVMQLHKKR